MSQLLSKNHIFTVFTSNFQCFRLAAGRRIETGDATDQWRDQLNAAALCPTQRQWFFLANWLSWIVNIDRPSVEGHPEQHNQLNLSLGCLGTTCQARSTLITQPVSGVAGLSASSDISRGSVATHLRCGGICSDSFVTNYCLLILTVKEFWKSANIWWSYEVYKKLCHFLAHPVYYVVQSIAFSRQFQEVGYRSIPKYSCDKTSAFMFSII